jgi:hypothetical protein
MSKYAGFNSVQLIKPKRSQFDMSHTKRLTTRAGRLTPVYIQEAIPGDTFNGSTEILLRLAPLLAPIYDMLTMFVHFFFVPNRLLWKEWEDFITGGRLGVGIDPAQAPVPPFMDINSMANSVPGCFEKSSLADYLGVPIFSNFDDVSFPADYDQRYIDYLPFAAYQKVWYDYYRDRNFVADDFLQFPLDSGLGAPGTGTNAQYVNIRTRAWEHDYFTSALPYTQRGTEVLMPIAGSGSVSYLSTSQVLNEDGDTFATNARVGSGSVVANNLQAYNTGGTSLGNARIENIDEVLLENSSSTINDFRQAYALQVWLERNEVAGSRYNESTLAHFGVRPQDERLQRAEYLGGGRIPVKISEIVSTAYSNDGDATVPLANLAGHGITYGNTNRFRYFCPEHGFIIGIMSIMSPPSYHQGLPRMFQRKTFLDYPWPTFAKLGEQEVHNYELYAIPENLLATNGEYPLFGYNSRYSDWKNQFNTTHGDFHDDLLFWTLTREFGGTPVLGTGFTTYTDSVQDRIFAVNGGADNFWCMVHNHVTVVRCLPYFGTPNTLGFV